MDIQSIIKNLSQGKGIDPLSDPLELKDARAFFKAIDTGVRQLTGLEDPEKIEEDEEQQSEMTLAEYFPENLLPDVGISLTELELDLRKNSPKSLHFTLALDSQWELIPDVFTLESLQLSVDILGTSVSATLSGLMDLEGYELMALVELPSLYSEIKLQYADPGADHPSPLVLLERFGSLPQKQDSDNSENQPKLSNFYLVASPLHKSFTLGLGIEKLPLGRHVVMDFDTRLSYFSGDIQAEFWGDFLIELEGGAKLFIPVSASHTGAGQGWQLEGGLLTKNVDLFKLYKGIRNKFGSEQKLPEALQSDKEIHVKQVLLSFNTATKAFKFSISLDFQGFMGVEKKGTEKTQDSIDLNVHLSVNPYKENEETKYDLTFSGQLIFKMEDHNKDPLDLEFDMVFDKKGSGNTFIAAYRQLNGGSINIGKLIHMLNEATPDLDFSVDIKEAYLIFRKDKGKSSVIFGASIGAGINLSKLPLVDDLLPEADSLKIDLQPYYANSSFKADELGSFNKLIPGGALSLPEKIDKEGPGMAITLQLGQEPLHLDFPIQLGDVNANKKKEAAPSTKEADSTSHGASEDGTKWFKLQKDFGPIQFERLGIQYQKESRRFHFKIDGGLSAAGLTLTLEGLSASIVLPQAAEKGDLLQSLDPKFDLKGLGLDFKNGALEIGASFLRTSYELDGTPVDEYSGLALISYNDFSLSAIGSIAFYKGDLSLFIYGSLNYPIGGPAFFFVTGLAAGFGFNRALRMPPIDKVKEFPLVKLAVKASNGKEVKPHRDRRDFIAGIVESLHESIPIEMGGYFMAVGIRFTSFKLLDSFILLTVSFGNHFSIDALGVSTLAAPAPVPGKKPVPPVAFVEMELLASFRPDEGFLGVQAQLTSKSYLFSENCHLRGGFAFFTWFDPHEHAGDFVLTLGGYHPLFKVPEHYPTVPRLGYTWQVIPELVIKGEFYFALTASALMAGGHFNATYQSGDVKAWFDTSADFIVSWQPYFYEISLHLELGVDVTIHFAGTHHLGFNLGADLKVWGPDFSGYAKIHLSVITFTISFGEGFPIPIPISWDEFQKTLLPKRELVCTAKVSNGLVKELKEGKANKESVFLVNPKEMELHIESVVPFNQADKEVFDASETFEVIGVGPLDVKMGEANLKSYISKFEISEREHFDIIPVKKRMPTALWGGKIKPAVNDPRFIENATAGFKIVPKEQSEGGATKGVDKEKLAFEEYPVENAFSFEPMAAFIWDETVRKQQKDEQRDYLRDQLLNKATLDKRNEIMSSLGFELTAFAGELDAGLADQFVENPRIGTFS